MGRFLNDIDRNVAHESMGYQCLVFAGGREDDMANQEKKREFIGFWKTEWLGK